MQRNCLRNLDKLIKTHLRETYLVSFFLYITYIIILPTNGYKMTQEKIVEIVKTADEFIDEIVRVQNKYIDTINGYLDDLERFLENNLQSSEVFIKKQLKILFRNIDEALKGLKQKIAILVDNLNTWYDDAINVIKTQIVIFNSAKLGIPITKEAAKATAKSMPHPELGLPDFELKVNIPNLEDLINEDTVTVINIPRIPTISR